jgi:Protein of unknown function (DUF1566)
MRTFSTVAIAALSTVMPLLTPAAQGVSPAIKCEVAKLKLAGRYGACRLRAEAKAVKKARTPEFMQCDDRLVAKWQEAERKAGGACPTEGDESDLQRFISLHTDYVAKAVAGILVVPICPAGQPLRTGQTQCYDAGGAVISCAGTGQDGELQKGLAPSYLDNGDGTVSDLRTGLMWEKLSDDGSIHDKDTLYTWPGAFGGKIATLNSTSFAGYTDWRVPNVNELLSLVNYGAVNPAVHAAFNTGCVAGCTVMTCNCTRSGDFDPYWSSTTSHTDPLFALEISFNEGRISRTTKVVAAVDFVRAVRSGL